MSHQRDYTTIRSLLRRDGISFDSKIGTFSTGGDVKRGPIFVGDFDHSEVERIQSYLDLAGYYPRIHPLEDDGTGVVIAGDGVLKGYVGDYDGDIDYEF